MDVLDNAPASIAFWKRETRWEKLLLSRSPILGRPCVVRPGRRKHESDQIEACEYVGGRRLVHLVRRQDRISKKFGRKQQGKPNAISFAQEDRRNQHDRHAAQKKERYRVAFSYGYLAYDGIRNQEIEEETQHYQDESQADGAGHGWFLFDLYLDSRLRLDLCLWLDFRRYRHGSGCRLDVARLTTFAAKLCVQRHLSAALFANTELRLNRAALGAKIRLCRDVMPALDT